MWLQGCRWLSIKRRPCDSALAPSLQQARVSVVMMLARKPFLFWGGVGEIVLLDPEPAF